MKNKYLLAVLSLIAGFSAYAIAQTAYSQASSSEIVIETNPRFLQSGDLLTLRVSLVEDLTQTFDFYFFADTPYGVYTVFFDGSYTRGIQPLYKNIPGYSAPYSRTVFDGFSLPSRKMGPYVFYAVVVRAGAVSDVTSIAELAADNDYVLVHVTETATTYTPNTSPTPAPPVNPDNPDRSGDFYLPTAYNARTLPLLVAFHGSGGNGEGMVNSFQSLADEYGFIIVAPDSDNAGVWWIAQAGYESDDYANIMSWVDYIYSFPGVTIDENQVMTLGFSGGCPVAPYIATNDNQFTHFASMHGEVWEPSIGNSFASAWLSTGEDDWWTPAMFQGYETMLQGKGFTVTNTIYPGGHSISNTEKRDVIEWWLD